MKRPRFRTRLFLILSLFAVVPSVVLMMLWWGTINRALPLLSADAAWDRAATSAERFIAAAQSAPLTGEQRQALAAHEDELRRSLVQAKRFRRIVEGAVRAAAVLALAGIAIIAFIASRVAGHLSRQLSRPLLELVKWTELLARGERLPDGELHRGAPEFEVLRQRMRRTARELELGRARALEAERLSAFRETARQVAHELKNPLTPIRFAVSRLRRDAPPELHETVEVLGIESERLERMARSFAQFGRLPEGPSAEVDLGELARYTAKATVPAHLSLTVDVEEGLPMVRGHYDALARAMSNVLINAVDACREGGAISVRVSRSTHDGLDGIEVAVRDTGCGISPEQMGRIWEPYVTHKPGGTGLGLAIARQTVVAHNGSVDAVSAVGKGTEIRFLLPIAGGAESATIGMSTSASTGEFNARSG